MNSRWLCLSLLSLGLSGCGDDPNPARLVFSLNRDLAAASSLAAPASGVQAMTSPPAPPEIKSSDGMRFALNEARAEVSDIRVELAGGLGCADVREKLSPGTGCEQPSQSSPATITFPGPFAVNLATGEPWRGGEMRLPPGTYRRVSFMVGEGGFSVRTQLFQDDRTWNMTVFMPGGSVLTFESPWDVKVEEGGSLRVTFLHDEWLKGVPLGACYQNGDLPREGSTLLLDKATGKCLGATQLVYETIRTRGGVRAFSN